MTSFLFEIQRTFQTISLLPWSVVNPSSTRILQKPDYSKVIQNESIRWVVIQILVLYVFYRLITPLLSSNRYRSHGYNKFRTVIDAWLFSALAIHTPSLNPNFNPRPTRLFVSIFTLFLVATHLILAFFTLFWHLIGWFVRQYWPHWVDTLWLPSGKSWKSTGIGSIIRSSLVLSLLTSLIFVGCTIESEHATKPEELPLICQQSWYYSGLIEDGSTNQIRLVYLRYIDRLSLLDSPVGTLWLSGLALVIIYVITERSSHLSLSERIEAAKIVSDSVQKADALWQTEIEHSTNTDIASGFKKKNAEVQPEFLEMSEWYSLALVDTAVQLLISLKLFFGRFDIRMLKRPEHATFEKIVFEEGIPPPDEFYFDWIADTGDGGDSTYQVARSLAKPLLYVRKDATYKALFAATPSRVIGDFPLPRGSLLLIGGDLAYPNPTIETLDKRLFQPFMDAMEPPPSYRKENVSSLKEPGIIRVGPSYPPSCYCLAGNHDHFDGLSSFYRCIVDRDWLGGWRLPQTTSYFAIKLIHGYWIFSLDSALGEDIDSSQFRYFQHLALHVLEPTDKIIMTSHEPIWLYDSYGEADKAASHGPLIKELFQHHLGSKIVLRVCGDLHNYMRYEQVTEDGRRKVNLVVSGGGGAFLHPTHCWPKKFQEANEEYEFICAYPPMETSRKIGYENLGSFRFHNWRFDLVGATMYFAIVASLFPRCGIKNRVVDESSGFVSYLENYAKEILSMFHDLFTYGYISPIILIMTIMICWAFAESKKGSLFRFNLGLLHAFVHILMALTAFIAFQITVETAIDDGLAGSSFYSLFDSYLGTGDVALLQDGTRFFHLVKQILRIFDIPESVAVPHAIWCSPSTIELGRFDTVLFYLGSYAYLYVISCDLVSAVLGVYLASSSGLLDAHFDESFSSLRNPHWKNFIRFKIDAQTEDLHCYVLGIDRTPSTWMLNSNFETTKHRMKKFGVVDEQNPKVASFNASVPSKWLPASKVEALQSKPRLIDYFVVKKKV